MSNVSSDPKADTRARLVAEQARKAAEAAKAAEAQKSESGQQAETPNAVTEAEATRSQVDAQTQADARAQAKGVEAQRQQDVQAQSATHQQAAAAPSAPANAPARGISQVQADGAQGAPGTDATAGRRAGEGGSGGGVGLEFEREMAKFIAKRKEEDAKKAMEEAQKKAAQAGGGGGGGAGGAGGAGGGAGAAQGQPPPPPSSAQPSSQSGAQPPTQPQAPAPAQDASAAANASAASSDVSATAAAAPGQPAPTASTTTPGAGQSGGANRAPVSDATPPTPSVEPLGTAAQPDEKAALEKGFQSRAQELAEDGKFDPVAKQAFGDKVSSEKGRELSEQAKGGDIDLPDHVRFAPGEQMQGKNAAYSPENGGTVFLNESLKSDPAALQNAYNEEVGHHIDAQLGNIDAPGDEGEIFAKGLESGAPISRKDLAAARADDDSGKIGGKDVEFQSPASDPGAPITKPPASDADLAASRPEVRDAFNAAWQGMTGEQRDGVRKAMDGMNPAQRTMAAEVIGRQHLDAQGSNPATDASTAAGKKLLDATTNSQPVAAPSLSHTADDGTTTIQHATGSTFQFSADGNTVNGDGFSMKKQEDGSWNITRGTGEGATTSKYDGDVTKDADGNVKFADADGSSRTYDTTGKIVDRNADGDVTGSLSVERRADGSETWKDQDGQLQRARDASGRTKAFHYDDAGKLDGVEITTPGSPAANGKPATDPTSTLYKRNADGTWDTKRQQGDNPPTTSTTHGAASVDDNGNVTFESQDKNGTKTASETFKSDGSTVEKNAQDQVTKTTTAAGDVSEFGYDAAGALSSIKSKDRTAVRTGTGENPRWSDGQKGSAEVLADGTLKSSTTNDKGERVDAFALTNGARVEHNQATQVASLKDTEGRVRATENAQGKGFGFGYDGSGNLNRVVDTNTGNVWNRAGEADRNGNATWRNQNGKAFNGKIEVDSDNVSFEMRDGISGDKFRAKTNIQSGKTEQTRYDGDTPVEVRHASGTVSARVKDSNGDWSNKWMQTHPPKTPGGEETKTIWEGGQVRPYDDGALPEPGHEKKNFNATRAAADIHRAVNPGWTGAGTDEDALVRTLDGLTDKQLTDLKSEYKKAYGDDMDKRVRSELSNYGMLGGWTGHYDRVDALLKGDQAKADAVGVYQATRDGWTGAGTKETELLGILDRQSTKEQRQNLEKAYKDYAGETLRSRINAELSGPQLDQAKGLLDGDRAKARAAEIRHAMKGPTTDEDAVYNGLSNLTAAQRQRVIDKYQGMYGPRSSGSYKVPPSTSQLAKDIKSDFSGSQEDRALALLNGDQALADAAKAKYAMHGDGNPLTFWDTLGTDEKALNEAVATPGMKDAYDRQYGGKGSFDTDRDWELNRSDEATNKEIEETGRVSDERKLWNAMNGAGTDERAITDVLGGEDGKGLSSAELNALRSKYSELTKRETGTARSLDDDIDSELSGRPDHDAKQLLKGRPTTLKGELDRLNENHAFERNGWSNAVSNTLNAVNNKGSNVDKFVENANAAYAKANADGKITDAEEKEIRDWMNRADEGISTYREARDALTDTVGTVATTAAVLGVAIASGGTLAAPALAGYAALAGAGANVASRWAVQGAGYQAGDAVKDGFLGALEGATVGLGAGKLAQAPFMAGLKNSAGGRFLATTMTGMAEGGAGGFVMGSGSAALQDGNWDHGAGQGLANVFDAGFKGGALGALTGGAMANALPPVVTGLKNAYGKARGPKGAPASAAPDAPPPARGDAPDAAPGRAPDADAPPTRARGEEPDAAPGQAPKVEPNGGPKADGDVDVQQTLSEADELIETANAKRDLADRGRRRLQNDPDIDRNAGPGRMGRERRADGTGGQNADQIRTSTNKLDRDANALMEKARTQLNEGLDAAKTPDEIAALEDKFRQTKPTTAQMNDFQAKAAARAKTFDVDPNSDTALWGEELAAGNKSDVVADLKSTAAKPDATGAELKEVANFAANHADTLGAEAVADIQKAVKEGVARRGRELLAEVDALEATIAPGQHSLSPTNKPRYDALRAEMAELSNAARKSGSSLADVMGTKVDDAVPSARTQEQLRKIEEANARGEDPRITVGSEAEAEALLKAWQQKHPSIDTTGFGPRKGRLFKGENSVHRDVTFGDEVTPDGKPVLEGHTRGVIEPGAKPSQHALDDATKPHFQIETPRGPIHIFF